MRAALLLMCLSALGCESCLGRAPIEQVEVHPYPSCDGEPLPEQGEVLAEETLRAGSTMARERSVVERYRIERRACMYVVTVHQEWARQVTDVEVVFDEAWKPVRAWKRMTIPGVEPDGRPDTRLYELRNDPPTVTIRDHEGNIEHRFFRGGSPIAVVGPGRGLIGAWIRAQGGMEVGQTVRGPVLDFREMVESVEEVALVRQPDREEPTLGGQRVRVYTVFGREAVFTDDEDRVIGDLAGLRRDEDVEGPAPEPMPTYGEPDPRAPL